jgi:Peptidase A4 family
MLSHKSYLDCPEPSLFLKMKLQTISVSSASATAFIVLSFLMAASAMPIPQLTLSPRQHDGSFQSTNWSGYAVTGASGSVSIAKGSWVVPAIQGSCTSTAQYSSFWVGIDGFNSGTVEQTGTDSDCQNGAPTYYAWFEFFPHPSFLINGMTITPGDHMTAQASFNGRSFTVTITDTTTGATFSTSSRVRGAQRSSAEWIAEAPSSSGGILPLANFGTVNFSSCTATLNGSTGTIGSYGSSVQQITMVTSSGVIKAQPSALSGSGDSFSVTWKSSGP